MILEFQSEAIIKNLKPMPNHLKFQIPTAKGLMKFSKTK